ncbi:MAG: L,D-transpeptidase family protein [Nocardioidaceae bacterium]
MCITTATAAAATGMLPSGGDLNPAVAQTQPPAGDATTSPNRVPRKTAPPPGTAAEPATGSGDPRTAPPGSGSGRRVVYDMSDQRVWLVNADESVRSSYLVSGSRTDNVSAGTYQVYSHSLHAVAFDGRSTMDYMVRFTTGRSSPIGFHDIPVDRAGHPLQRVEELGSPRSHGCIRQRTADARRLWRFAPVGTTVVVLD